MNKINEYQASDSPLINVDDPRHELYNYDYDYINHKLLNIFDKKFIDDNKDNFETVTNPLTNDEYVNKFIALYEEVASVALGGGTGMGAVVTSTPSSIPGQTIGSNTVGGSFGEGGIVGSDVAGGYNKNIIPRPERSRRKQRMKSNIKSSIKNMKKMSNMMSFTEFNKKK